MERPKLAALDPRPAARKFVANRTVTRVIRGRARDPGDPARGRFTARDLGRITERAWGEFEGALAEAPEAQTAGGRKSLELGAWTWVLYRALVADGVEKEYARSLVCDVLWKTFEDATPAMVALPKLAIADRQKQLNFILKHGFGSVFPKPDYAWTARATDGGFLVDLTRCLVHDYYRKLGDEALELFRKTWCTVDYPYCESLVEGGRYERPHTLSHGDAVCDMRWMADSTKDRR